MSASGEFGLIERIAARVATRSDVVLGIGDDGALLRPPAGHDLALVTDTLNAGIHFPVDTAAHDIGWKALAVNLSDLAAMGAQPVWCTLALSLPDADDAFVDAFIDGFLELAALHRVALVGGDTTRGPLSATVTACGFVTPGRALRRDAARAGDDIWVSGSLGDAATALRDVLASVDAVGALRARLDRPTPRVELGHALQGVAHACIDLSDGLLQDLGHVCAASALGAEVWMDALPTSDALRARVAEAETRWRLQTAGDDYELCFTASVDARAAVFAAAAAAQTPVTRVGRMVAGAGVVAFAAGQPWSPGVNGFDHFA